MNGPTRFHCERCGSPTTLDAAVGAALEFSGASRPNPDYGWRCWSLRDDGVLLGPLERTPWMARRVRAQALNFFAYLSDAVAIKWKPPLGISLIDGMPDVWGLVRTGPPFAPDPLNSNATWLCREIEIVVLLITPCSWQICDYGVPVVSTTGPDGSDFLRLARELELPVVDRPPGTLSPTGPLVTPRVYTPPEMLGDW